MIATLDQTRAELPTPAGRSAWLGKLARLRAAGATVPAGTPSETVLDDLRAERGS